MVSRDRSPRYRLTGRRTPSSRISFRFWETRATGNLHPGKISFLIIGVSYFIASEISLSMGLTTAALVFVGAEYFTFTGTAVAAEDQNCTLAGAYFAYFLILLFIGRHYYWGVIARALGIKRAKTEEREQVWADGSSSSASQGSCGP